MKKVLLLILLVSSTANAGILDVFQYGIKDNPDRYASLELLAGYGKDRIVLEHSGLNGYHLGNGDNRWIRGELLVPINHSSTFVLGGQMRLSEWSYENTRVFQGYDGRANAYEVEVGFKFYIHD